MRETRQSENKAKNEAESSTARWMRPLRRPRSQRVPAEQRFVLVRDSERMPATQLIVNKPARPPSRLDPPRGRVLIGPAACAVGVIESRGVELMARHFRHSKGLTANAANDSWADALRQPPLDRDGSICPSAGRDGYSTPSRMRECVVTPSRLPAIVTTVASSV